MAYSYTLQSEIAYLKGVGPKRAELLEKELGVRTFEDMMLHFPFRYVDRSRIYQIKEINPDLAYIQLVGAVTRIEVIPGRARRLVAHIQDDSGTLELVFFKGLNWYKKFIVKGQKYLVYGKPNYFKNRVNIIHPELELYAEDKIKQKLNFLQPVYPTTEKLRSKGLESKGIAKIQHSLVNAVVDDVPENLPAGMLQKFQLMGRVEAFRNIHFPGNMSLLKKARQRLKFEELLFIQLRLLKQKQHRQKRLRGTVFENVGERFNRFYKEELPFDLTNAQKRVMREIRQDVRSGRQMNRLLQGDVGSGKTIVALMAMLLALDNGTQACMMAPTEILATQHYNTLENMLSNMNVHVRLLTGSTKSAARKEIHNALLGGQLEVLVGTHALLEEKVKFNNLGLVVIDEQHRFGVAQRARLWAKNKIPPHMLVMTATPIPRTLAMTLYGDLDTSVIDELPPGRQPIKTSHAYDSQRLKVFGFIRKIIKEGRQVYIVYPLIEESEKLDYKNLQEGFEAVCREFPKPDYQVSIVHGQMKPEDKEYEMQRFKRGETQIMVSTTVIEVGVDVPNATVMVIESAERFGLSQLHQLRGRVGRGGGQSYCVLMTSKKLSNEGRIRMETMVRSTDGFEISEVDLELRGPGDIAGTRQSGILDLKVADLATDQKILKVARIAAMDILQEDPELKATDNHPLKRYLDELMKGQPNWSLIS